jgi:putative sterol carrier protein
MAERAVPPPDIAPADFFTRWIPESVAGDPGRRARLGDTDVTLEFELTGEGGGWFTLEIGGGEVRGRAGASPRPDLHVRLDVATWRALNSGALSAPEAFLRRRIHLRGNLALALKLHLIIG